MTQDASIDQLFGLAMGNIQTLEELQAKAAARDKQAFVPAAAMAPALAQDPSAQAQPQPGQPPTGQPGMPPGMVEGPDSSQYSGNQMAPETAGQAPGQPISGVAGMPPEVYDQLVAAVRQVMQEMGSPQQGGQQPVEAPAQAPAQASEKPKAKGRSGVDPEEFAHLQAAVAMILEQLGMVSAGDGLRPATPEALTALGANPGQSAELLDDAAPLMGPLDPAAGQTMGDAGQAARVRAARVGKLASLIRGQRS